MKSFNSKLLDNKQAQLGEEHGNTHFLYGNAHYLLGLTRASETVLKTEEKSTTAATGGLGCDALPKFNHFKSACERFCNYFAVRTAGNPESTWSATTEAQACDKRWLSHDMAVMALRRFLPAVVSSLSKEAGERNDAQALGLLKFVQTYNFVAAVHTFCDALPSFGRTADTESSGYQRRFSEQ